MLIKMNSFQRLAVAVSVPALVTAAQPASAEQRELPGWARSLVKIWTTCQITTSSGAVENKELEGTGVVLTATGNVATAAHVGRDCEGGTNIKWRVGPIVSLKAAYSSPAPRWNATLHQRLVDNLKNPTTHDLALLKVTGAAAGELTPIKIAKEWPVPGDTIQVAGFSDLPFFWLGDPAAKDAGPTIFTTQLMSAWAGGTGAPQRLHYGGGGLSGLSGGPVVNGRGELIGIHSSRASANVTNVLSTNCSDGPCDSGLSVAFQVPKSGGGTETQIVRANPVGLKGVLENYGWATAISRIPAEWLR
jgi:hypothetical protein